MTVFRTRRGIILTEICGEYILVAARSLLGICPYLMQLNESSAFLWKQMLCGATMNDLLRKVEEEYETTESDGAALAVESFVRQMLDMKYLESEEVGEKNEIGSEE